jgi:hypothetical protein
MDDRGTTYDDAVDLTAPAVRRQSWEWLLGLARRLGVTVELLDNEGYPLLPPTGQPEQPAVRRLLASNTEPVRKAIAAALIGKGAESIAVNQQLLAFAPLATTPRCVLAVARPLAPGGPEQPRQLQSIAAWLGAAAEAQLRSPRADEHEVFERISALQRVLAEAAGSGREGDVVRAFAEALAIWEDIEVRGYVENVAGLFVLDVMLPGSIRSEAPLVLDEKVGSGDVPIVRLPRGEAERLGFMSASDDVLISRLGTTWVVALCGRIPRASEARLGVYVGLLAHAVQNAANVGMSRTTWSTVEALIVSAGQFEPAARRLLDDLKSALGATAAVLLVTTTSGGHLLATGDTEPFEETGNQVRNDRLTVTLPVADRHRMTLGVARPNGPPFHRPEQRRLEAVGRVVASWLPNVLAASAGARERRQAAVTAEEVLDRRARQAVDAGESVTLVLVSDASAVFHPGRLQQCITAIRGQLRPEDVAAAVGDHEIAVLLPSTSVQSAAAVVDRLQHDVMAEFGTRWGIGIAGRSPATISTDRLLDLARRDADHHASA